MAGSSCVNKKEEKREREDFGFSKAGVATLAVEVMNGISTSYI